MDEKRLQALFEKIRTLSPSKFSLIERAVERHATRIEAQLGKNCPKPFTKEWAESFGDALQTHHAMSAQNLGKDRFEFALIESFEKVGVKAEPSSSFTRAGYDVMIAGEQWSLKTQGDKGAKADEIHISKYMEMGKGKWETAEDLPGLRDRFLHHMEDYSRIFTLRHWVEKQVLGGDYHYYELVEIPKPLLQEAKDGKFEWMEGSKQTPKPGYCRVSDGKGGCKFELYFDGGTERKLQLKHLKKVFCNVVAVWRIPA